MSTEQGEEARSPSLGASNKPPNSIQVSLDRTPAFYARIGKRMFGGYNEKPAFDEIVITGLGTATKTAIGAASMLEREKEAVITKIETCYHSSLRSTRKRLPKITITVIRHPDAPPPEPSTTEAVKTEEVETVAVKQEPNDEE